jgi:uncharacterized membrane protein YbhN (UPF0104 family)
MTEQRTNIRKSFNYLIRALIIIVTYGFIYYQIFIERRLQEIPGIYTRIMEQGDMLPMFILLLILMLVNWSIESVKWKILISKIERVSFFRAFKAVMTGVSVSLFTPNRTGDYLGRVFILEKGNHIEGIFITLIGSFSQIVVTFSVGLFCFLSFADQYLRVPYQFEEYLLTSLIFLVAGLVFLILLFYFNIGLLSSLIVRFIPGKWERFSHYALVFARFDNKELLGVLLLSLARFVIFSTQFYLLLRMFGAELPVIQGIILIPVIYLAMAMVPTVALTELGIRGSVSIFVIGLYFDKFGAGNTDIELAILTAATVIWFINLIIPAILGTFFVFSLKFFRK